MEISSTVCSVSPGQEEECAPQYAFFPGAASGCAQSAASQWLEQGVYLMNSLLQEIK